MAFTLNNNEFLATLTNLALQVITFDQVAFKSPFGVFKRQYTKWGDKIACVNAFAPSGKNYGEITNPYEENKPETYEATITTKLRKVYPLTLNNELLRGAFEDENSLGMFLNTLMAQLVTFSEIDIYEKIIGEFADMFGGAKASTVQEYSQNAWNGYVQTGELTKDNATEVYRKILQKAREMKLPNNAYGLVTDGVDGSKQKIASAMGQDLVLILTPEASALFDVYVNASLFNAKEIDIAKSIKTVIVADIETGMSIPKEKTYYPATKVFGILATEDIYRYSPRIESMEVNRNGATMGQHYHYHVWTNMGFTGSGQVIVLSGEAEA